MKLPFIMLATTDSPDNEIDISYGEGYNYLNIAMRKNLNVIGDVDTLMMLGFYRVPEGWLREQLPRGQEGIMNLISEEELSNILIPNYPNQ